MRKPFGIGIFTFVALLFTFSLATTDANAQLSTILRTMDQHNKSLNSVIADVTMAKYDAQLQSADKPMKGETKYLPKQKMTKNKLYVRIDWKTPVEEYVSIIDDKYELWRPRINQVIFGTTSKAKSSSAAGNALGFMNMSRDQLKANYDVEYLGEESLADGQNTKTWHLRLTPKTATSYKLAELWVDGDGMPRQGKITEKNNDTTTVLLSNIRKNKTIPSGDFSLKYPSSVKKVPA